jgi:ABC-type amino acid transport substrate-binding protein
MSNDVFIDRKKKQINYFLIATFILSLIGLFLPWRTSVQQPDSLSETTLQRVQRTKVLRIGYEGYPPYTIKEPGAEKLSGYSVDMANYLAKEAGWTVEWVQTNPDTKVPDLVSGRFDMMAEPIFRTIPRATSVSFTRPYAYFGYATAIVRKGEKRFTKIEDLNNPNITIAVRSGYTDQAFAEQNLSKATIRALNVTDANQIFLDVLSKNADVALSDTEQAKSFAKAHSGEVDILFSETPPAFVAAGFMLKQGDFSFYNFLDTSIDYMESNNILDQLDTKYQTSAWRNKPQFFRPDVKSQSVGSGK